MYTTKLCLSCAKMMNDNDMPENYTEPSLENQKACTRSRLKDCKIVTFFGRSYLYAEKYISKTHT